MNFKHLGLLIPDQCFCVLNTDTVAHSKERHFLSCRLVFWLLFFFGSSSTRGTEVLSSNSPAVEEVGRYCPVRPRLTVQFGQPIWELSFLSLCDALAQQPLGQLHCCFGLSIRPREFWGTCLTGCTVAVEEVDCFL